MLGASGDSCVDGQMDDYRDTGDDRQGSGQVGVATQ